MVKLFLSSIAISPSQAGPFAGLVGKPIEEVTIGLIKLAWFSPYDTGKMQYFAKN